MDWITPVRSPGGSISDLICYPLTFESQKFETTSGNNGRYCFTDERKTGSSFRRPHPSPSRWVSASVFTGIAGRKVRICGIEL